MKGGKCQTHPFFVGVHCCGGVVVGRGLRLAIGSLAELMEASRARSAAVLDAAGVGLMLRMLRSLSDRVLGW